MGNDSSHQSWGKMSDFNDLPMPGDVPPSDSFGSVPPPPPPPPPPPSPAQTWAAQAPLPAGSVPTTFVSFQPVKGLATAAKVLLVVNFLTAAIFGFFRLLERGVVTDFRAGAASRQDLADSDSRINSIVSIMQISWIVSIVIFLMWFFRSRKNAAALGDEVPYVPGMAIGSWFIPLANLVMPLQIALGMWRKDGAGNRRGGGLVIGWWTAFVGGLIVRAIGENSISSAVKSVNYSAVAVERSLDNLLSGELTSAIGGFALAVGALLAIMVVTGLSKAQEQRFAALSASGAGVAYSL